MKTTDNRKIHNNRPGSNGAAQSEAIKRVRAAATAVRLKREELYDRYAERVRELYEAGREKTAATMDESMKQAREQLATAGHFTRQQGQYFEEYLRRDLQRTAVELSAAGKSAAEHLNPARLGAGALASMGAMLDAAGDALKHVAWRAEKALEYRTGEITSAGTLTCEACGLEMRFKSTGTVPPCPGCARTAFRKGY